MSGGENHACTMPDKYYNRLIPGDLSRVQTRGTPGVLCVARSYACRGGMRWRRPVRPCGLRQRYEQRTGRDPCICPPCQGEMAVWRIWHPTYGVIYDEGEVITRGTSTSSAPRAGP